MSSRSIACAAAVLALAFSGPALAQNPAAEELQRLQAAVSVINAEIKANLDEALALQETSKANSRAVDAQARAPGMVMFDDVAAAQKRVIENDAAASTRLDAIQARNAKLEAEKRPLLDRIRELLQVPPALR